MTRSGFVDCILLFGSVRSWAFWNLELISSRRRSIGG